LNQETLKDLAAGIIFLGCIAFALYWKIRHLYQLKAEWYPKETEPARASSSPVAQPVKHSMPLDDTPDEPIAFGYKISWLTIRSTDTNHVARVVGLTDVQPANWETGLEAAIRGERIFVSPAIEGWIFVAGSDLPELAAGDSLADWQRWLAAIAAEFSEVQYFGSERVIGYCAWARFVDGRELRAFSCTDEAIHVDRGAPATVERNWSANDSEGDPRPDEEDLLRVAAEWGFNPMTLEDRDYPRGVGLVGRPR